MDTLNLLIDNNYFTPKILPDLDLSDSKTTDSYSKMLFEMINKELNESILDSYTFSNHFTNIIVFMHPDSNNSFIKMMTHYYGSKKTRYICKFEGFTDNEIDCLIEPLSDSQKIEIYSMKNHTISAPYRLKAGEFNEIIKILCDKHMICSHKIFDEFCSNNIECLFCNKNTNFCTHNNKK
jgi:hypothetical protein